MAPGFARLMWAQFNSATADNALLLIAMALWSKAGGDVWWIPLLKVAFTVSYVVMAPWAGALADAWPKSRMMAVSHGVKLLGCGCMLIADDPRWGFAMVGLGAALYSPAKYGWVTEQVQPVDLVKANGWIETSSVTAALVGIALGGFLVSSAWQSWLHQVVPWIQSELTLKASLIVTLLMYSVTLLLTIALPASKPPRWPQGLQRVQGLTWLHQFRSDQRALWQDPLAGISLSVTTLFWGVGACLQVLVLQWGQAQLGLSLSESAGLQGVTALSVVLGAWLAGQRVPLHEALRVLPLGLVLALLVPLMIGVKHTSVALGLALLMGAISGGLVVPMNALLQHRGQTLLSGGRSIAVQNFNENLSVLVTLGLYAVLIQQAWPWPALILGLSIWMGLPMVAILIVSHRQGLRRLPP